MELNNNKIDNLSDENYDEDLLQNISCVSLHSSVNSTYNHHHSCTFTSTLERYESNNNKSMFGDEIKEPPMVKCHSSIRSDLVKLEKGISKNYKIFNEIKSKVKADLVLYQNGRMAQSLRIEKLLMRNAELKEKQEEVEEEYRQEEERQNRLTDHEIELTNKSARKTEKFVKTYKSWKKTEQRVKEKFQKALQEKDNTLMLLERLGVTLVKNKIVSEEGDRFCFEGITFTNIDPVNPDAEFTIYFEEFDENNWTFKVVRAHPTFPEFEKLSKIMNENGKLSPFIHSCRNHWTSLVGVQKNLTDSLGSSSSSDLFEDADDEIKSS